MRKKQENKFTMVKAIETYLDENQTIVSGIPELDGNHNLLKSKSAEITLTDEIKKNVLAGKSLIKLNAKNNVITKAIAISGALYAYGKKIKDEEIVAKSNILKSNLSIMRDTELLGALKSLKDLANEHLSVLEPFGVTTAKLNAFSERIDLYQIAIGQKETSTVMRSGAVKSLATLFKEVDEILLSIDKLVNGLNEEQPDFVRNYYIARNIKNLGIRHRKDEPPQNSVTNPGNTPQNTGASS